MSQPSARVTKTELQNCTLIRIEGEINETFDSKLIGGRHGVVVFDLGGVRRITSHGVLNWINGLRKLDASYYCFVNCRPCSVDQFNLVNDFPQRGEMVSFFMVFTCPDCGTEVDKLIDLRHQPDIVKTLDLPQVKCPKCGGMAEFDDVPELYLRYVFSAPPPRPPAAANAAIGGDQAVVRRDRRFHMKKEIDASMTVFWLTGLLDQGNYFKRAADGVQGTAVVEVSDLDGIAPKAVSSFGRFLKDLGDRAFLARVPAALVEPLREIYDVRKPPAARVASVLVPLRCTGCQTAYSADVATDKVAALVAAGARAEMCTRCMHPLEPLWPREVADAVAALPSSAAPQEVEAYLRSHPPAGRMLFEDKMLDATGGQELLLGKYQVLYPLGQGGMGEVFLARHIGPEHFEKLVVLKRIRRDRIGDPQSRELFLKEARIAARLSHPNIVRIFDLERMDDEYIISMEYVNGIDLGRALSLTRHLRMLWPIEICCRVLADLCAGLQAAHSHVDEDGRPSPIVHRDVSPSNILLSTDGMVKLTDFGIARAVDDVSETSAMHGKAGYAAPEQGPAAAHPIDERTDIYAAGVVLFETITLRSISRGQTQTPTAPLPGWKPHSPPQIGVARAGAPPLLQDIFERATQADPSHRYRSARDLGRDLERIGRLVADTTPNDVALWVRRLVALMRETEGHEPTPIVTMSTGSISGSFRPVVDHSESGRGGGGDKQ